MAREPPNAALHALTYDILISVHQWHLCYPYATFQEIEEAKWTSAGIACGRSSKTSRFSFEVATWQTTAADRPTCPARGRPLIHRWRKLRQLKTHGGQDLTLTRSYGYCPTCQKGLFPPR